MKELLIKIRALFEGRGADEAATSLDKVADSADKAADAAGKLESSTNSAASDLKSLAGAADEASGATDDVGGSFFDGNAKAGVFAGGMAALSITILDFAVKAVAMAIAATKAIIAAFIEGIGKAVEFAASMTKLSAATGEPIAALVVLQRAFENAGISASKTAPLIQSLQTALSGVNEKGEPTAAVFDAMGLSIAELRGMNADQAFAAIGTAIAGLASPTEQAAAATAIWGKNSADVLAVLQDGAAFTKAAEQVGSLAANTEKAGASLAVFSNALGALDDKKMGFFMGAAAQFATDLEKAGIAIDSIDLGPLGEQVGLVLRGAIEVGQTIKEWAGYITSFTDALNITGPIIDALKLGLQNALDPLGIVNFIGYLRDVGATAVEDEGHLLAMAAANETIANSAQIAGDFMAAARAESAGLSADAGGAIAAAADAATASVSTAGSEAKTGISDTTATSVQEITLTAEQINLAAQQLATAFQTGMGQDISPALQALVTSVQTSFINMGAEINLISQNVAASMAPELISGPLQTLAATITTNLQTIQASNMQVAETLNQGFGSLAQVQQQSSQNITQGIQQISTASATGSQQISGSVSQGISSIGSAITGALSNMQNSINQLRNAVQALAARG